MLRLSRAGASSFRSYALLSSGIGIGLIAADGMNARRPASCGQSSEEGDKKKPVNLDQKSLPLRLVQYNVRGLTEESGKSAVEAVGKTLSALAPTIVCLNEVDMRRQPSGLSRLAEVTGLPHQHFFGHWQRYGNALLSNVPIVDAQEIHLDGGTVLEWPPSSGNFKRIGRGMLAATLQLEDGHRLTVYCTHLDHMSEKQRMVQMTHALQVMQTKPDEPHLLSGDLNALRVADYSAQEWAALERKAVENNWSPPSESECLYLLARAGYADAFREAIGAGNNGSIPEDVSKCTAHTGAPMYRIDYVMLSPEAQRAGLDIAHAYVDASAKGSDHFPLVVDFVWRPACSEGEGSRPAPLGSQGSTPTSSL